MARLSRSKVLELVKSPKNGVYIQQAIKHEQRLILHTEPILERQYLPQQALNEFLLWVKSFLPGDKYERFCQLLTLPFDTVESTKSIFDELNKFLDAQDQYINYEFVNDDIANDFNEYQKKINEKAFWSSKGLDALKNGICSLIVIDLPQMQTTSQPEPYFYILNISKVCDVEFNKDDGSVEYIIFKEKENEVIVIDSEFYRVLIKENNTGDWTISKENRHTVYNNDIETVVEGITYMTDGNVIEGIGYTPVCAFYDIPIANSKRINKRGPLTDVLGKLDWLLMWRTSQKYLNLYGAWPIIVTYEEECNFKDALGRICEGGFITKSEYSALDGGMVDMKIPCPKCSAKTMIGPGNEWTVPAPRMKDEVDLMENPVKFVEISNDKLEYGVQETNRLEEEIYLSCVGYDGESQNKQAINEDQVNANFENKEAVLDGIKKQFEKCMLFANSTIARIRYGDYFIKGTVDLGNEYFLKSVDELTGQMKLAKDSGLPMYFIGDLRDQITRTKFKNNPEKLQREIILQNLEPYLDLNLSQVAMMKDYDPVQYYIKVNFTNFIARFEREQTNIIQFGSMIPFNEKISLIQQKLVEYANERIQTAVTQPDTGGNG